MTITLTSKEFDEAVSLWLKEQGFTTDRYDISTRVIVGRGDSGAGTRVEATLEPITTVNYYNSEVVNAMGKELVEKIKIVTGAEMPKRFGQGHSDE